MLYHSPASAPPNWRGLLALSCLSVLVLGASQADALPGVQLLPAPRFLFVEGGPPDSELRAQEKRHAALADLNEFLKAARAIVAAATELREELQALKQENERLTAELQQASARRTELVRSNEFAEARIAELSKAVDMTVQEAARIDDELAGLRRQNAQLNESLARTHSAREAAQAQAEKTRAAMETMLDAATYAAEQSRAELTGIREELRATRQQVATANSARDQSVARVSEMEEAIERSRAEAERVNMELAATKEQLGQAAGAAGEAERARQAASSEAERTREELAAAKIEIERLKTANSELRKEVASWDRDSRSAIEAARDHQIFMEETIEELKAALGLAPAAPALRPQLKPDPGENERPAETYAPSAKAQVPAREPARKIGAEDPPGGPRELSDTELSKWRAYVIGR